MDDELLNLEDCLNYDPIKEAEDFLGISYKDGEFQDQIVSSVAYENLLENNKNKEILLAFQDDTNFSETETEYLRKVHDIGFRIVYKEEFANREGIRDRLYLLWHDEYSILLKVDTFTITEIAIRNSADMYFYLLLKPDSNYFSITNNSSGGFVKKNRKLLYFNQDGLPFYDENCILYNEPSWIENKTNHDIWVNEKNKFLEEHNLFLMFEGHSDVREAIKYQISKMKPFFVKEWYECPYMFLRNHMEKKTNIDINQSIKYTQEVSNKKLSKLPKDIQERIKFIK